MQFAFSRAPSHGRRSRRGMRALDHKLHLIINSDMANLTAISRSRARILRKDDTQAERVLWEALRSRRLGGHKFVRQLSIGPYFADFACREHKLVVEVDGATHGEDAEVTHDERRTAYLNEQGWRIYRCWNHDVFTNLGGVCDSILLALLQPK
jgi:very-short-patch-repair endonuclease